MKARLVARRALDREIEKHQYIGIRDQDGWEVLELTIRANHPAGIAKKLLKLLEVPA